MRQVVLFPGEDGYWVVECPGLPGCISQGKTKEEAISNIKEAICGRLAYRSVVVIPNNYILKAVAKREGYYILTTSI